MTVQEAAQQALHRAVVAGTIIPGKCELRGDGSCQGPIQAHHDDYTKPLDVRWLCASHHLRHHKEHGRAAGWEAPPSPRLGRGRQRKDIPLRFKQLDETTLEGRLVRVRLDSGMTQRNFADRLGIGLRTLRNFEAGVREPKVKDLRAYVAVTGKSFDYFLSSEGTTP